MLYNDWRPQNFSEIEGQSNIVECSVVNTFSQNITIIKVASLIAGIFCFVLGGFIR